MDNKGEENYKMKNITFEEAFYKSVKSRDWQEVTFKKNVILFNLYFKEFKPRRLAEVTLEELLDWKKKVVRRVVIGEIKPNQANRAIRIMKWLIDYGNYLEIFEAKIKVEDMAFIKEPKEVSERLENNYLTLEELTIFLNEVMKLPTENFRTIPQDFFCFMCSFLYYTGLRINEARGVRLSDFKEDRRGGNKNVYIHVSRQMEDGRYQTKEILKNGNGSRKVFLKQENYNYFRSVFEKYDLKMNNYVFDCYKNDRPITRKVFSDMITRMIKLLKKNAKLPEGFPDVLTPHGFRYSNTLYLKKLGLSVENIAKMQGHTVAVMLNIYTRSDKHELENIFGNKT